MRDTEFAPELTRTRGRTSLAVRNELAPSPTVAFEAASQARRLANWRPPTVSPNAVLGLLSTLRDRSRHSTRNDGYAKAISDKRVSNLIGTGIKPLSQAPDSKFAKELQALWLRWTDQSDADGLLDYYGQQTQAVRSWNDGGEVFARLRPRYATDLDGAGNLLCVPIQVQMIEPEQCPYTHTGVAKNGNNIRAGIEFDRIGRRIGFYFHPSRPDVDDFDASRLARLDADAVIHMFDPLRPGQLRGVPHLAQALVKLFELDKFDAATVLRQQLANLFVAFIKRDAGFGGIENLNPLTGLPVEAGEPPTLSMEPGILQELEPGEDVTFSNPPGVGDGYEAFTKQQLRGACVAAGVPYEIVTGEMSGMNDRTARVVLNDFKRSIQMAQHQIIVFQFCRRVWSAWIEKAWMSGAITFPAEYTQNPGLYAAVKWIPPRWAYLHPVQDVDADKEAIRNGFTTRSAVVSEYGEDAEQIDEEQKSDNARADLHGLRYDSDGRQAATAKAPIGEPATQPAGAYT